MDVSLWMSIMRCCETVSLRSRTAWLTYIIYKYIIIILYLTEGATIHGISEVSEKIGWKKQLGESRYPHPLSICISFIGATIWYVSDECGSFVGGCWGGFWGLGWWDLLWVWGKKNSNASCSILICISFKVIQFDFEYRRPWGSVDWKELGCLWICISKSAIISRFQGVSWKREAELMLFKIDLYLL